METIIIKLDSKEMENPDLDIRYLLPEMIEEYTSKKILDNDLAKCSKIYISPKECSEICDARKVFPV